MHRNPISDKRKPFIRKAIAKFLVNRHTQSHRLSSKPEGTVLFREKIGLFDVGPFKLTVFVHEDDIGKMHELRAPVRGNGFQHRDIDRINEMIEKQVRPELEVTLATIHSQVEELLGQIDGADPTAAGEYAAWIATQVLERHLDFPDDIEKVKQDLGSFHDLKNRGIIPQDNRDIKIYETYGNFFETLRSFGGVLSDRQRLLQAMQSGKEVYSSETYRVLEVKRWELAKHLATGTAWCVRGTNMAKHYLQDPEQYPLYFFFKNDEQYALLTNLHNERQFRDVNDVSIKTRVLEEDVELRTIVSKLAIWLVCPECETIHPKKVDIKDYTQRLIYNSVSLQGSIAFHDTKVQFRAGAYIIFEIPPAIIDYPVVASKQALSNQTLIGPAYGVIKKFGKYVRFPSIQNFFDRAGFTSSRYAPDESIHQLLTRVVHEIIRPELCACGGFRSETSKSDIRDELLHALYIIQPCEDFGMLPGGYVVCGHEPSPKYRGPCCPPRLMDYGPAVGMRCECGAFVPSGNRYSICPACLEVTAEEDEDYYPMYEESLDHKIDDCPISSIYDALRKFLTISKQVAEIDWNFRYDPDKNTGEGRIRNPVWDGQRPKNFPTWDEFSWAIDLMYHTNYYEAEFSSNMQDVLDRHSLLLHQIKNLGYFDKDMLIEHIIPVLQEIQDAAEKEIDAGHPHCCPSR